MIPDAGVAPHSPTGARRRRGVPRDGRRASRDRSPSPPASPTRPSTVLLALRGSGQALYVGLAEDAYVVASEPYGVVEETIEYLRIDGETPAESDRQPWAGRRARRPTPPARSTASSGCRTTAPSCRSRDDDVADGADHHPRHRPRRVSRTSCSRRSPRRRRRSARRCAGKLVERRRAALVRRSGTRRSRVDVGDRLRERGDRARRRDRPGHRCGRGAEPCADARRARPMRTDLTGRGDARRPSCPASACDPT